MITFTPETTDDHDAIELLLDHSFGPDRTRKISYRYRHDVAPVSALSYVAREFEHIVGSIRYWPVLLAGQACLLLGPLAIAQDHRGQGIGRNLTRITLDLATRMGYRTVFLVGELEYYRHLGFRPAPPKVVMPQEAPQRLQFQQLDGAGDSDLSGVLEPWRSVRPADVDCLATATQVQRVSGDVIEIGHRWDGEHVAMAQANAHRAAIEPTSIVANAASALRQTG